MEYSKLLDLASDLGYGLAMSGAETFRVEESINRVLAAYEIEAETFVIPNCMHISIEPVIGRPQTRMRRIGAHGNDLDAVERYSNLSRRICQEKPAPEVAAQWLAETKQQLHKHPFPVYLLGNVLGAFGFCFLFGGGLVDALFSGLCGLLVGLIITWMDDLGANEFFRTIAAAFPMALLAYIINALLPSVRSDCVIIGALMILVPGLLMTNGMRDIIYGDTNSGINRMVQVLLIAIAIALGAAFAWSIVASAWAAPVSPTPIDHGLLITCLGAAISCYGFTLTFNVHGPGALICVKGGVLTWVVYVVCLELGVGEIGAYFCGAAFASAFSEISARIRKCPAIAYLVLAVFPLIPGAGVYYTMEYAVQGEMDLFASKGMTTAAIAGAMALGILLISTVVRLWTTRKAKKK